MTESAESSSTATPVATVAASAEASALSAGSLIGGYRVTEALDQGPEATLYQVVPVAAGEPRFRGLADSGVLVLGSARRGRIAPDRFAEAARRLAGVEHPALARPLHGGVTSDRRVWIVYGDHAGEPLDLYCDRHRVGLERRVEWLVQVLGALASAHSQLVLHGFLAPELVRVVETEDGSAVLVLGFGLHALAGSGQAIDGPGNLRSGVLVTPLSSPEELLGEPLSVASDVYRAGLLLLRLVVGVRAEGEVLGDDPESGVRIMIERSTADPGERFQALGEDDQAAIAAARCTTPRALAEKLHGELGRVITAALAEVAAERPPSADALASRLQAWLSTEGFEPPRVGAAGGRRRQAPAVAALAAVVAIAATTTAWWSWREAADARRSAERARIEVAVERELLDAFGFAGWPREEEEEAGAVPAALERALEREGPAFAVASLDRLGELAARRGEVERALALHGRAVERAVEVYGESSFEAAEGRLRAARSALALGAPAAREAEAWSRRAFGALGGRGSRRPAEALEARLLLGKAVVDQDPKQALDLAERALELLDVGSGSVLGWIGLGGRGLPSGFDVDRARFDAHLLKARALLVAGEVEDARAELELAAASPAPDRSPALAADLWGVRALVLERSGAAAGERVAALERELEARAQVDGETALRSVATSERLAAALAADGRLEGAIARAVRTAEITGDPSMRARAWQQAGTWQLEAGRPLEALVSFEASLADTATTGREWVERAILAATSALRGGRSDSALAHLERAPAYALDAEQTALLRAARARALASADRPGAGVALREALDGLRLAGADGGPAAAPLLIALGERLTAEGEAIVAEAYLRRALTILEQAGASGYLRAEAESALGEGLLAQGRVAEASELLRGSAALLADRDDQPARAAQRRLALLEGR